MLSFHRSRRDPGASQGGRNAAEHSIARAAAEALEGRRLFAAFVVNTLVDAEADDGKLSLREAITAVNDGSTAGIEAAALGQVTGTVGTNDAVTFDPALFPTPQTMTLATRLSIETSVQVHGPGADRLRIESSEANLAVYADVPFDPDADPDAPPALRPVVGLSGFTLAPTTGTDSTGFESRQFDVTFDGLVVTGFTDTAAAFLGGTAAVRNSTFTDNVTAVSGGGAIEASITDLTIENSTIGGNTGRSTYAGGVTAFGGTLAIRNSTIVDNDTNFAYAGGGVWYYPEENPSFTLQNSIVAGNSDEASGPSDITLAKDAVLVGSHNVIGDPGSAGGLTHGVDGNVVGKDDGGGGRTLLPFSEIVSPLADNGGPTPTYALAAGSPALNAGSDALVPPAVTTDQRGAGFPRKAGPAVDVGAFEAPAPPSFSITELVEATEGNSGVKPFVFTVTRTSGAGVAAVDFTTVDGSAGVSGDYNAASGSVFFPAGVTSKTVTVYVRGDTAVEPDQDFFVALSNPINGSIDAGIGRGLIVNDDLGLPQIAVNDVAVSEGNAGTKTLTFALSLSRPTDQLVTFKYKTANGSAASGSDYNAVALTSGKFVPRQTSMTVSVTIKGDATFEPDETFYLDLSAPTNAAIADNRGVGTIVNDDAQPRITINNAADVQEGNSGTRTMTFTVKLSNPSASSVTVKYATADGTAQISKNDYVAKSGTLTFAAGETSKTVTVTVVGDTRKGVAFETVLVNLSAPVGASILDGQGVGRIVNDD